MILDEQMYLEHHGVKGMKWGQRRAAKREAKAKANAGPVTAQQVLERRKQFRKKVAIISAATLGAYVATSVGATYLSSSKGQEAMHALAHTIREKKAAKHVDKGRIFVKDFIDVSSRVASNSRAPARLMLNP
jgi:hypothetical protein